METSHSRKQISQCLLNGGYFFTMCKRNSVFLLQCVKETQMKGTVSGTAFFFSNSFTRSATLNLEKSPSASVHSAVSSGWGALQKHNTPRLEVGPRNNLYTCGSQHTAKPASGAGVFYPRIAPVLKKQCLSLSSGKEMQTQVRWLDLPPNTFLHAHILYLFMGTVRYE